MDDKVQRGRGGRAREMMMCGRLIHLGLVLTALLRQSRAQTEEAVSVLSTDVNVRSDDVAFSRVPFACDAGVLLTAANL